jgi:ubiquitin C-terminal hydrolase
LKTWSSDRTATAQHLRNSVANTYTGNRQQDPHEFWQAALDKLPAEAKRLFAFTDNPDTDCQACQRAHRSVQPVTNTYLLAQNNGDTTAQLTFQSLFPDMQRACTVCGKQNNRIMFGADQKYLVVTMPLFETAYVFKTIVYHKVSITVTDFNENNTPFNGRSMKLIGAIQHDGDSPRDGHYTSWQRSNNTWININDYRIRKEINVLTTDLSNVHTMFFEFLA